MTPPDVLLAVPNISEGRDDAKIVRIAGTGSLLDISSDTDHNRTVLTYGGPPDDVFDDCYAMIERAVAELDVNDHDGVHPRFGVVDVLPFVASDDITDAVAELVWRIARGPGVPTFTYGRASPDERTLPDLRRALRNEPPVAHPTAGVICIGIRDPLIAFNVNVRGELVDARRVAKAMRELPGVRALGFALPSRGLVQISMNLTDLASTGPKRAYERTRELAVGNGLEIVDAEIVGLVPESTMDEFDAIPLREPVKSFEERLRSR